MKRQLPHKDKLTSAVVTVGKGGRGFIVEGERPLVITAAHCLPSSLHVGVLYRGAHLCEAARAAWGRTYLMRRMPLRRSDEQYCGVGNRTIKSCPMKLMPR